MEITTNLETDEKRECQTMTIRLSNGDDIWVYDDKNGYCNITVTRHDSTRGRKKSSITTSTQRDRVLGREQRFKNTMVKRRCISLYNAGDIFTEDNIRQTEIECTHFYEKKGTGLNV